MTVSTTTYFTDWSAANGINKNWSYDFQLDLQTDVEVLVRDGTDDTTIVVHTSDLQMMPSAPDAGYIVYPVVAAALAVGKQVRIRRNVPFTQNTEIGNEGDFRPEIHEKALDKLTMMIQQLNGRMTSSLQVIGDGVGYGVTALTEGRLLILENGLITSGPNADEIANAQSWAELAQKWAENPEDVTVDGVGTYSSLHWAAKSEDSAAAAALSESNAATILANIETTVAQGRVPIGTVIYFATPTPPAGYLECNGNQVSALYPDLRALLIAAGSPFGSGGGNPLLPNLRGEFMRGWDNARGVDTGRVFGSAQLDASQGYNLASPHDNTKQLYAINENGFAADSVVAANFARVNVGPVAGGNHLVRVNDGTNGVPRTAAETRGRNIAMLPCIKAFGAVNIAGMADLAAILAALGAEITARIATQPEAEGGTNNTQLMTPLRTAQAVFAYTKWKTLRNLDLAGLNAIDIANISNVRELRFEGSFVPVVNGTPLLLLLSTNNGSSYINGASDYYNSYFGHLSTAVGTFAGGAGPNAFYYLIYNCTNQPGYSSNVKTNLVDFNKVSHKTLNGTITYLDGAGITNSYKLGGQRNTGALQPACNALRIIPGSGNILSGHLHVEGLDG